MLIPLKDDNPTTRPPIVTVAVIVICVAVFLYQFTLPEPAGDSFILRWGMVPSRLFGAAVAGKPGVGVPADLGLHPYVTVVTSMFMHGGILHIAGNLLYFWIFANNIEDSFGHLRFAIFYLLCGIAAAMTQALVDTTSGVPMVGASGAIAGVLGSYLILHPRANVTVLFTILIFFRTWVVPAMYVLGFWFAFQIFNAVVNVAEEGGGVAWFAHIGGFLAGVVLTPLFRQRQAKFIGEPPRRGPWG